MDTSFTFVTAFTPSRGKVRGVPKFSKLSTEKKSSKSRKEIEKSNSNVGQSNKCLNLISNSMSKRNDTIPSLKSCSESLHLSSDKSDVDENVDSTNSIKNLIQEVHAGLERITFRKKKYNLAKNSNIEKSNDLNPSNYSDTVLRNKIKASTPTDTCNISNDESKSSGEELSELGIQLCNLSLKKHENNDTKTERRSINKKFFTALHETRKKLLFEDSSGIISDDISPILRVSVAPCDNMYVESDDSPLPLKSISEVINGKNNYCDDVSVEETIPKTLLKKKVETKPKITQDGDKKKKYKRLNLKLIDEEEPKCELPKEEVSNKGKTGEKPAPSKSKKGRKKKDSFIASDTSSVENESMTVYHKLITENIKIDVIKTTTPRSKYRNNAQFHDDGIFTPFINKGKRSSSEDSSSENENEDNAPLKKKRLSSSDDDSDCSKPQSPLSSLASVYDEKFNQFSSSSESLPIEIERKKTKKLRSKTKPRRRKVILSDSSPTNSVKSTVLDTTSPAVTPGSGKKQLTFKLNNLKSLTPTHKLQTKEPLSFLESLSTLASPNSLHPDAGQYRKSFKKLKEQLARKLFVLFNKEVFDNKLPDDLKIEWNPRMRSSSGLCYNRRIKTIIGPNNDCLRVSKIALSPKIIESPERLRDTLIHEMCHAAAWIIDNKADGHGPFWKSWVIKAQRRFPELPPIRRCHDYSINTKFKYTCVNCGYTIGRHSKSLNLERKRCGYCYGRFELHLNYQHSKKGGTNVSPRNVKVKPLSKFALFVKENYGTVKNDNSDLKHGEIMKLLGKKFAETKI